VNLSELIAKLIDLEIEHGETPVYVRDGRGILGEAEEVSVTSTPDIDYLEIGR
jgi:hypothetical protein